MTRWGSLGLASQVEGEREPPTSRDDSLGSLRLASQVEGLREPPTSQNDLLPVGGRWGCHRRWKKGRAVVNHQPTTKQNSNKTYLARCR